MGDRKNEARSGRIKTGRRAIMTSVSNKDYVEIVE
jgi:hypothetical protein